LAEIGEVLGVTESRVSQIHTKSVLQLRSRMSAAGIARTRLFAALCRPTTVIERSRP
jgi:DNA-directed RNA polymerase sigma subunit (sigma70/sigma32)